MGLFSKKPAPVPISAPAAVMPAPTPTVTAAPAWKEIQFDLATLADYPAEKRHLLTEEEREQASWLASVLAERVRNDQVELPAFPGLAVRVLNLMEDKDPDLKKLVQTIREDALISAQLLRIANSAFYSRGIEVTTVQDAAVRLGMKSVSNIAVAAATKAMMDAQEREYRASFSNLWQKLAAYSLQSAAGARWLSIWLTKGNAEEAFLGGLLHDIGKIVALRALGGMVVDGDASVDLPEPVVEAILEEVHVAFGCDLAVAWSLPGHVAYACEEHHKQTPEAAATNTNLHLIRLSSGLYESRTSPLYRPTLPDELFWSASALGLSKEPLQVLATELKRVGGETEGM